MYEEPITKVSLAIQTFIMPQIEQNMYLNALKPDIFYWIYMSTISQSLVYFCSLVSPGRGKI